MRVRSCIYGLGVTLAMLVAGCGRPGVSVGASQFMAWPMTSDEAYKARLTITDTKDNFLGMPGVAAGVEIEFSEFTDRHDVDWTYVRVGVPLMASQNVRGGFWDYKLIRGWPSLPADQQTAYFRGAAPWRAWLFGFSAKYLRSEDDEETLAIGPSLAIETVRQISGSSAGWGVSFEADTGLNVAGGDHYLAISLGFTMVFGGPVKW